MCSDKVSLCFCCDLWFFQCVRRIVTKERLQFVTPWPELDLSILEKRNGLRPSQFTAPVEGRGEASTSKANRHVKHPGCRQFLCRSAVFLWFVAKIDYNDKVLCGNKDQIKYWKHDGNDHFSLRSTVCGTVAMLVTLLGSQRRKPRRSPTAAMQEPTGADQGFKAMPRRPPPPPPMPKVGMIWIDGMVGSCNLRTFYGEFGILRFLLMFRKLLEAVPKMRAVAKVQPWFTQFVVFQNLKIGKATISIYFQYLQADFALVTKHNLQLSCWYIYI